MVEVLQSEYKIAYATATTYAVCYILQFDFLLHFARSKRPILYLQIIGVYAFLALLTKSRKSNFTRKADGN